MIDIANLPLPPKHLRWGGVRFSDDTFFLQSGVADVAMLEERAGLNRNYSILDVGCGSGRLLLGLLQRYGGVTQYIGLDVYKPMFQWCKAHLAPLSGKIDFLLRDIFNQRYNPKGGSLALDFPWPLPANHFNLITLFSVFSHMWLEDIRHYLNELVRILAIDGRIYLTLFVEDDVIDEEENPKNYHREWKGPLHCVLLNRQTFEAMVRNANLRIDSFRYRHTPDGQSSYVLSRRDQPPFQVDLGPG